MNSRIVVVICLLLTARCAQAQPVLITEFMAINGGALRDEDSDSSDWIELFNAGANTVDLDGWYVTDNRANLVKWTFPATNLPPQSFLVVFASGKNRRIPGRPLHTSFSLSGDGEYLGLVMPDGLTVASEYAPNYPPQTNDIAYGFAMTGLTVDISTRLFLPPTPGAQNSLSGPAFMGPPIPSAASGVYTVTSLSLSLTNTNGSGTIRYTTDGTLPSSASTLYTTSLVLAANSTIKARIFPPAGTNLLPSDVVARNFVFLDGTSSGFSSKLPTMIISTEGRAIPQDLIPGSTNRARGSIVVIDTDCGRSSIMGQSDVHQLAAFEHVGQTSAGFPKRPIRVEIQDQFGNDLNVEVLGMPADSDWRLRNPYNDKTMMNDFLGFELWEKMGHYSVRRKLVEVFLDTGGGRVTYPGDYYGMMVLCETIKVHKDRVDIPNITPYQTNLLVTDGGFIFKRDKGSAGDLNFSSPGGSGFAPIPLKLHEPKVQSLRKVPLMSGESSFPGAGYTTSGTNQLNYLRSFLGTMEGALYAANWTTRTGTNHYSYYLDPIAFADQMLHVELTKQIEGYRLSAYFTKGKDGRVGPGPVWDWTLAFGNANYLNGGQTNGWYYEAAGETDHPWARRLITGTTGGTSNSGDPNFTQLVADRWSVFRTNVLNGTNLLYRIDELALLMTESAARDLYGKYRSGLIGVYTWPNPDGSGEGRDVDFVRPTNYYGAIETRAPAGPTNSIIGQMKKWMLGRYLWMDRQFTLKPTFTRAGGMVAPGTQVTIVPPAGAVLYYTLNGRDPRVSGGGALVGALSNNGPLTVTVNANTRIFARAKSPSAWKSTWSSPNANTYVVTIPPLRITEVMYNPAPTPSGMETDADKFEYIELMNISGDTLDLAGYRITGGIEFVFPSLTLRAGEFIVVVKDLNAFQSRFGTSDPPIRIAGAFTGNLANDGDRLILLGPLQELIHDFVFADDWYPATDGLGFALVSVDENGPLHNWSTVSGWRPSTLLGGSPGQSDPPAPPRPPVLINELLSAAVAPLEDAVELFNPTTNDVDISGWYLSDDLRTPQKFRIPDATIIPAGGFLAFDEHAFNVVTDPPRPESFTFGADGDEAYLFSADATGNLTGHAHGFRFGAAEANVTFGPYRTSTGEEHFVAQTAMTLFAPNAGPRVGPVVLTEIQYRPLELEDGLASLDNTRDEFIELHNITDQPVPLYYTNFQPTNAWLATNTWRLEEAVEFAFPPDFVLPPRGFVVVTGFNPNTEEARLAAFRAAQGVPETVPVLGPWRGQLANSGETVGLTKPAAPSERPGVNVVMDRVKYSPKLPWSAAADGLGLSLQRAVVASYGNDPTNWAGAAPTPGASYIGGDPPMIVSQPGDQLLVTDRSAMFVLNATGTPPLRYQWRRAGRNILNATNSVYAITNVQVSDAGVYNVLVYNSGGAALGTNFTLITRVGLRIVTQPAPQFIRFNNHSTNRVVAVGTGTLRYQWRRNGSSIVNATNSTLIMLSVQSSAEGTYEVVVSDDVESTTSISVPLMLIYPPVVILHPISTTALLGGNAYFSIMSTGSAPMSFRWRKAGVTYTAGDRIEFSGAPGVPASSILVLTNAALTDMTNYSCVVSNIAGNASVSPPSAIPALLTVVTDMDGDGLPDSWEMTHPGFDKNNPADGAADTDQDGMSNSEEYLAGTDYLDPMSYLRVDIRPAGLATLEFLAISNRTYSVQYSEGVNPLAWETLAVVLARTNNRVETVVDRSGTNRIYRLTTPITP